MFTQLMIPFSHLGYGKYFGELALSADNKLNKRAASVICRSECTFATLTKSDY